MSFPCGCEEHKYLVCGYEIEVLSYDEGGYPDKLGKIKEDTRGVAQVCTNRSDAEFWEHHLIKKNGYDLSLCFTVEEYCKDKKIADSIDYNKKYLEETGITPGFK